MLLGLRDECPSLWFVKQSQQYAKLEKKYANLIKFLCVNAAAPRIDLHNAFLAATSLAIYYQYNSSGFMWANTTIMETSIRFYWEIEAWLASIPEIRRLSAGWFLQIILEEIHRFLDLGAIRRMVAYSSHDDNVASLTSSILGYLPRGFPDYGDFIAIELHSANGSEYIEVWRSALANDSHEDFQMDIDGCPIPCTLEKFDKFARFFIPSDWLAECYGTWTGQSQHDELRGKHDLPIGILIVFNVVLLILSVLTTFYGCRYRRELQRGKSGEMISETNLKNYERIEPVF